MTVCQTNKPKQTQPHQKAHKQQTINKSQREKIQEKKLAMASDVTRDKHKPRKEEKEK